MQTSRCRVDVPLRTFGAAPGPSGGLARTAPGRASPVREGLGLGQPRWAAWKRAIVGWSGAAALFEALHGLFESPATAEGKAVKPAESRFDFGARRAPNDVHPCALLSTRCSLLTRIHSCSLATRAQHQTTGNHRFLHSQSHVRPSRGRAGPAVDPLRRRQHRLIINEAARRQAPHHRLLDDALRALSRRCVEINQLPPRHRADAVTGTTFHTQARRASTSSTRSPRPWETRSSSPHYV